MEIRCSPSGRSAHASDAYSRTRSLESHQKYRNKKTFHLIPDVADDDWMLALNLLNATPCSSSTSSNILGGLKILQRDINMYKEMKSEELNLFPHSLHSFKRQQVTSFCTQSGTLFFRESRAVRRITAWWLFG